MSKRVSSSRLCPQPPSASRTATCHPVQKYSGLRLFPTRLRTGTQERDAPPIPLPSRASNRSLGRDADAYAPGGEGHRTSPLLGVGELVVLNPLDHPVELEVRIFCGIRGVRGSIRL